MIKLEIGNANSKISELTKDQFRLLEYELQYRVSDPIESHSLDAKGNVKINHWDGFKRLMNKKGVFPSGLIPRVIRLTRKWGWVVSVTDLRRRPDDPLPIWRFPENFVLRDYQLDAVNAAEKVGRGVIDSPPRTGKTVMMAELVRRVADYTVITAPTRAIASQTYDVFLSLFGQNDWAGEKDCSQDFYLLTGGAPISVKERRLFNQAKVFIATAETAANMPGEWWEKIQCLIVDERHHQAAKTYHTINKLAVNAYYRWGFTGTNYRSDPGEQLALEACLGRIVAQFSIQEMKRRGVLVGGQVYFVPIYFRGMRSLYFKEAYNQGVVSCNYRNQAAAVMAQKLLLQGRRVLILVHRIKHGQELQRLLQGSVFVQGEDGEMVRQAVFQLNQGKINCLIGTSVVGEGLDCPSADALIYVKARKAKVTHTQDVFRVLTGGHGKKDAIIIDFADRHNRHLEDHSVERMRNYINLGLKVGIYEKALDADLLNLQAG